MSENTPLAVFQDWLESYLNFERLPQKNIFWLDTMQFLCRRFNHPENSCRSVHVAGSKGKGSVSVMINSILRAAGFKCGLYTSPHIVDFSERIGTGAQPLSDAVYEAAVKEVMYSVDSIIPDTLPGNRPITWFELVTLFAFVCFRREHADWGVFETGLGGRLDATNVLDPDVCVITPIELEHTEFLGNTVELIAAEKAGIIKPGVPVCIAPQTPGVRAVFEQKAAEAGAAVMFLDDILTDCTHEFVSGGMNVRFDAPLFSRPIRTTLRLSGSFQAINAALAAAAVKTVYPDMDESLIEYGLSQAVLPGRFEVTGNPAYPVILDGAHTVRSIMFTLETFGALGLFGGTPPQLLFACAADKDVASIAPLFRGFEHITLTRPGDHKQSDPDRLCKAFSAAGLSYEFIPDYAEAIRTARSRAEVCRAPLLITGSFYLLAEVKKAAPLR